MDFIYLPESVVYNIYYLILYRSKTQGAGLKNLVNLRCTSKIFALPSSKILDVLQNADKSRALSESYIIKKLCAYIRTSNITSYTAFITLLLNRVKSRWLSRLRSQQLLYVVRFSTVEFLKQYTDLDCHSLTPVRFTEKNIIKATDIANERKDGNDILLYLCPMMISLCFIVSDPQHIHMIMNHIISGNKLNSSGDYFRYLLDESQHRRRFGDTILDSALLLPLLNPPRKEVLVVPKGTIYRQFNMQPPIENHGKFLAKLRQGFTITMNDGIATISYIDQQAKIRTIKVHERNGTYTYEDFSTDSLYELFVRTSIFAQIYGTFEQQHVALTEENIDLEPIDQPWFFGAISEEEADEILSNAAPAPAIITRSIGADICVCYTRTKFLHNTRRSNYSLTMKFRDILTRTDHSYPRFYSALYNGGERKNLWVYLTYRAVISKPLDEIIKFIKDNEKLVKLAWKFGNEDNYFKKLPKELIEVICRSTDIDRPDWWDIMAPFIVPVDSTKLFINLPTVGLFELAPFVNNYWDKLHCNVKKYYATRLIEQFPIVAKSHQDKARMIVKWTLNFARKIKSFYFVNSVARDIFTFATLNDFAQPLLEAMLSIIQPNSILGCLCSDVGQGIDLSPAGISQIVKPATWGAVLVNNRPLIKFFLEKGYLHIDKPNASIDRLTELVKSTNADTSGLDYLCQLMSK